MKNTKVIVIGIIFIVAIIILTFKPFTASKVIVPPQPPTSVPAIATATSVPSQFSAELKAKIRSEFINTCHTKGKYSVEVCTCGADYLSANYSESDLADMYRQYHSTNVVPKALETAADKCIK